MTPTSVKLSERQRQALEGIERTYGVSRSQMLKNALDLWLTAFETASDKGRMAMVIRPRTETGKQPKGAQVRSQGGRAA